MFYLNTDKKNLNLKNRNKINLILAGFERHVVCFTILLLKNKLLSY